MAAADLVAAQTAALLGNVDTIRSPDEWVPERQAERRHSFSCGGATTSPGEAGVALLRRLRQTVGDA